MPSIAFLFDMAAKSTVLLGVACLLILALRRPSAAARYFTWICAFASVLALPVLSELLPRWDLRVKTPLVGTVVSKAAATDVAPITAQRPDAGGAPVRLKRSVPWLAVIWLSGALLALARLAAGHVRLALSMRRAVDVRVPDWLAARDQAAARIGLHRAVKMKRSSQTDVPLTCGVFFATIVLPDASGEWDAERRHVVLLHELTHARRRDPLLWLMVQIAAALYWFHPLGWLALAGFRREPPGPGEAPAGPNAVADDQRSGCRRATDHKRPSRDHWPITDRVRCCRPLQRAPLCGCAGRCRTDRCW